MREAGAPSTGGWVVPAPPGVVMVALPEVPRNAGGAMRRPRSEGLEKSTAKGIIEAGVLHLASLQRGSLILREDCYNVVTWTSTVGNDSLLYPTASERGECMLAMLF